MPVSEFTLKIYWWDNLEHLIRGWLHIDTIQNNYIDDTIISLERDTCRAKKIQKKKERKKNACLRIHTENLLMR